MTRLPGSVPPMRFSTFAGPRSLRSSLMGAAAAALWAFAIAYPVIGYFGGDARVFIRVGSRWEHPAALAGAPVDGENGYDGQFFAALATDPLLLRPGAARLFDAPAYRASRAGLPLLAWLIGAGNDRRAIFAYQVLCWALGALLVWVVGRWLEERGEAPWLAGILLCSAGVVSSMYSSLPDAAAATLMVSGLWLHSRGWHGRSVALLSFASLVKETTLIAAAAVALAEWRQGRRRRAAGSLGVPLVATAAWRLWVLTRLGFANARVTGNNFGWPFTWVPEKVAEGIDGQEAIALLALGLAIAAGLALLSDLRSDDPVATSLVGFAFLAMALNRFVYVPSWWNYARVLLPVVPLLLLARARRAPWLRWLLAAAALAWSVVGGTMLPRLSLAFGAALAAGAALDARRRHPRSAEPSAP